MHRWSQLFIPTLREAPADAEVASHKLLLRAGYIRQLGAGIYSFLPLGQRSLNKIIAIVREEMNKIGQEFLLPTLNPLELWQESGRDVVMGQNMFHLKDRKGAELVLAMTHEEVMTSIARNELRSYKQLPQIWYQIQTKFRDEPRPKGGLLRVRQFIMKDSYSFDIDQASLDQSYDKHDAAYRAIFTRCGLEFVAVEADSGAMGGSGSQEFMVYTEAGEDLIASSASGYAANLEKATSKLLPVEDLAPTGDGLPELVSTPGKASIADVTEFFGIQSSQDIKCVAFMGNRTGHPADEPLRPVVAFLRGDHQVNETKLAAITGTAELRPMLPEELELYIGGPAGFLGPIGIPQVMTGGSLNGLKSGKALDKIKGIFRDVPTEGLRTIVIMDLGLEGRSNLVAGANKLDFHFRNVTPARDFTPTVIADIRNINEGEPDPIAGEPLRLGKAVEIGHIFKLGNKYTASMGARVLNADGKEVTPIMGCYGIGIERILTAAIESSAAKNLSSFANGGGSASGAATNPGAPSFAPFAKGGVSSEARPLSTTPSTELSSRPDLAPTLSSRPERSAVERPAVGPATIDPSYALPAAIAPFACVVTITNVREPDLLAAGEKVASALDAAGIDTLLDDRDERAGVKFKDAELIGIPYRINIGKKLSEGLVELVNRLTHTTTDLPIDKVTEHLRTLTTSKP